MAKLSDATQLDVANKLTLGIASTSTDKNYFEENFPWLPTVVSSEIWAEDVPFANTVAEADAATVGTEVVVDKFVEVVMDEIPLSNEQGWAVYTVPGVPDPATRIADWLNPQQFGPGYFFTLFESDGTIINLTGGRFQVDNRNGIVRFDEGFTPADLGLLTPLKITFYRYSGIKGVIGTSTGLVPHQQELVPQAVGPTDGDVTLTDILDFPVNNPESVRIYHNKLFQVQGPGRDYQLTGPGFRSIIWQPTGGIGTGSASPMETTDELIAAYSQDADTAFGPTGPTGPTGSAGSIGPTGPTGPAFTLVLTEIDTDTLLSREQEQYVGLNTITSGTFGFTVTLPATPVEGDRIWFKDQEANASVNNVLIDGNGNAIDGDITALFTVEFDEQAFMLQFAFGEWRIF